mmetsp:Transcript_13428/g.26558  ORF Transcript_13428/g.26558 Transcript_13428/m.26558 type:complete len:208 (+) Transcript_13428:1108-1731(+)
MRFSGGRLQSVVQQSEISFLSHPSFPLLLLPCPHPPPLFLGGEIQLEQTTSFSSFTLHTQASKQDRRLISLCARSHRHSGYPPKFAACPELLSLHHQREAIQSCPVSHVGVVQNHRPRPHRGLPADLHRACLHHPVFEQMSLEGRVLLDGRVVAHSDQIELDQVGGVQVHTSSDLRPHHSHPCVQERRPRNGLSEPCIGAVICHGGH